MCLLKFTFFVAFSYVVFYLLLILGPFMIITVTVLFWYFSFFDVGFLLLIVSGIYDF